MCHWPPLSFVCPKAHLHRFFLLILFFTATLTHPAYSENPAIEFLFESSTEGFESLDRAATLRQVTSPLKSPEGTGYLEFQYSIRSGGNAIVGRLLEGKPSLQSLSLHLHPNTPMVLLLSLKERDGSTYTRPLFLTVGWQFIHLNLRDLPLAPDSEDENGALDSGEITLLTLGDFFSVMASPGTPIAPTHRTLAMDSLRFSTAFIPRRIQESPAGLILDDLRHHPAPWIPFRRPESPQAPLMVGERAILVNEEASPTPPFPGGAVVTYRYPLEAGASHGLTTLFPAIPRDSAGMEFWCAVGSATTFTLLAREINGGQYSTFFHCPSVGWHKIRLKFSDFKPMLATPDENGVFDFQLLRELTLTDMANEVLKGFPQLIGNQRLLKLSPLLILPGQAPPLPPTATPQRTDIDDFVSGPIRWQAVALIFGDQVSFGLYPEDTQISLAEIGGGGLEWRYPRSHNRINGILRPLHPGDWDRLDTLFVTLWSTEPATLAFHLKEANGSRFQISLEVPGGPLPQEFPLPRDGFKIVEKATTAENEQLDLSEVVEFGMADLTRPELPAGVTTRDNLLVLKKFEILER